MGQLNRAAYEKLIEEDVDWLKKRPGYSPCSLEASHIEDVLHGSVKLLYPEGAKWMCAYCGCTSQNEIPLDQITQAVAEHMVQCRKSPVNRLIAACEALKKVAAYTRDLRAQMDKLKDAVDLFSKALLIQRKAWEGVKAIEVDGPIVDFAEKRIARIDRVNLPIALGSVAGALDKAGVQVSPEVLATLTEPLVIDPNAIINEHLEGPERTTCLGFSDKGFACCLIAGHAGEHLGPGEAV